MEGPALDLFKAKLEAVMAEARSQQAASMTEFHWLGHRFPISNAKTRVAILKAQELEKDIHGLAADSLPAEKKLAIFDKIFTAYHEARSCIRSDLNIADLSDLVNSGRDRKPKELAFSEECALKSLSFRAERCFYLAKSYSLAGKRAEAYALYCRAWSLAEDALQKFRTLNENDQIIKELKMLCDECRSNSCIEHATGIMEEVKAPENLSKRVSNLSLTGADKKLVIQMSRVFRALKFSPPTFQAIPQNPIVLDLTYNFIEFPSLESRMKKEKKGFLRLW